MERQQRKTEKFLILAILFLLPVYLIKINVGWVSFNALEILIGVLFLVWLLNKDKKCLMLSAKYFLPTSLIFASLVLSVIANKNYYSGLGAIKGWFLFPLIFAAILFDQLKKDENLLKKSLLALFFSGVTISIIGIVYKFLGIVTYDNRLAIFWDSSNQLAMFLAVPFLVGVSFVRLETRNSKQFLLYLAVALIVINLFFSKSFGAWLGIATALLAYLLIEQRERLRKKYVWAFFAVLIFLLAWTGIAKYGQISKLGERSSLASRLMIWKSSERMIKNNPLFGIGPGNFQNKYLEYQKYFSPYLEWSAPQPHNLFLAFWLQSGLFGLVGFVWILVMFFRDNKKVYPPAKIREQKLSSGHEIKKQAAGSLLCERDFGKRAIKNDRDLGVLFLAIMFYILVHGLVDTTYWRNDLAIIFWTVVVANMRISERDEKVEK